MNKSLILHIGLYKTGTTSIQKFLSANSDLLCENRILYPSTHQDRNAHHRIAMHFVDVGQHEIKEKPLSGEDITLLRSELDSPEYTKTIISSECFAHVDGVEGVEKVKQFFNALGFEDITVVCFFRRQDYWIESLFSQEYKTGYVDFNVYSTLRKELKKLDYAEFISPWTQVFGKQSVEVRILDKTTGYKNAVTAFTELLGLEQDVISAQAITAPRVNKTLTPVGLHYAHLVHRYKNSRRLPISEGGPLFSALEALSDDAGKYSFIDDATRQQFLQKLDNANEQFSELYLNGKPAFSDFKADNVALMPRLANVDIFSLPSDLEAKIGLQVTRDVLVDNEFIDINYSYYHPTKLEFSFVRDKFRCGLSFSCRACGAPQTGIYPYYQESKIHCSSCFVENRVMPFKTIQGLPAFLSHIVELEPVLWGAGELLRIINALCENKIGTLDNLRLVDGNELVQGFSVCGKCIESPDILADVALENVIIMSVVHERSIIEYIRATFPNKNIYLLDVAYTGAQVPMPVLRALQ